MLIPVPESIPPGLIRDLIITAFFLATLLTLRHIIHRALMAREDLEPELRRRWLTVSRNTLMLLMLIGITLIWAREIQTVALSLVAIAAALVLATREMILCVLGTLYRTSTQAYGVGDRIEINGLKGQVVDTTLLSTTLVESNQAMSHKGTVGRLVTLPNSLLLTQATFNESALGKFVIHTVHLTVSRSAPWQQAEQILLEGAREAIQPYSADMVRHARELQRLYGLGAQALSPRVRLVLSNPDHIELHLQLPTPLNERVTIEQRLLRRFLVEMARFEDALRDEKKPG